MRVALLSTSYPRWPGDWAGNFVQGFARYLRESGSSVTVVAAGESARAEQWEDGLRVVRVPGRGLFFGGGAPEALSSLRNWPRVPAFVGRMALESSRVVRNADALVSHWLLPSALVGSMLARGRPHLAIAHSGDVALCERLPLGGSVPRALCATGARVAFVSRNLRDRFVGLGGERVGPILAARSTVCPMGIDTQRFASARSMGQAGRLTVLFIGRLVGIKGAPLLARVVARIPGVELHIAGGGPGYSHWKGAVMHGEVGFAEKLELIRRADVLVLPSLEMPNGRTEGAPTVVMEAMAAGLPVVATRTGGVPELIEDERTGLLVPSGDEGALAVALRRMRDDVALRVKLGAAAAKAATALDWSRVGPRLLRELRR